MQLELPDEKILIDALFVAFDLFGTFVFAVSGGITAARHRVDPFGVVALSIAAGTSGGVIRDVLIGAVPPAVLQDWRYVAAPVLAAIVTVIWSRPLCRLRNPFLVFDAAGLALFAVAGAGKALAYNLAPVPAALMGMVTGIGGGVIRDVLVSEIPVVFRRDIYAVAALAGASILVIGETMRLPSNLAAAAGAGVCFSIRMLAICRKWTLPVIGGSKSD